MRQHPRRLPAKRADIAAALVPLSLLDRPPGRSRDLQLDHRRHGPELRRRHEAGGSHDLRQPTLPGGLLAFDSVEIVAFDLPDASLFDKVYVWQN
jgi:hypothetical protein